MAASPDSFHLPDRESFQLGELCRALTLVLFYIGTQFLPASR
jgi:hypothetical protein